MFMFTSIKWNVLSFWPTKAYFLYSFYLLVPSSVRNFTCSETLETEITLAWLEPEHKNGIIKRYQVSDGNRTEDSIRSEREKMFEGLRKYNDCNYLLAIRRPPLKLKLKL